MLAFFHFKIYCLTICYSSVFLSACIKDNYITLHVPRIEISGEYKMLVVVPEPKRQLGRPRRKWDSNIKMMITLF